MVHGLGEAEGGTGGTRLRHHRSAVRQVAKRIWHGLDDDCLLCLPAF